MIDPTAIRTCLSKAPYPSKKMAREEAARLRRRDASVPELRTYACPFGDHYHLTHQRRAVSVKRPTQRTPKTTTTN